jgi:5-methylcytosine-specific restriction endonuclease McrA
MNKKEYMKIHYKNNKEKYLKQHREYYLQNRAKILKQGKLWRENNQEKIKIYRQRAKLKSKQLYARWIKSPNAIYGVLKSNAKSRKIKFNIKKEQFVLWYNKQLLKCFYCKRSLTQIQKEDSKHWKHRILRLTIDRKNNKKGYKLSNLVLACPLCNGIKSDYFSAQEMLIIGKSIKQIIRRRYW